MGDQRDTLWKIVVVVIGSMVIASGVCMVWFIPKAFRTLKQASRMPRVQGAEHASNYAFPQQDGRILLFGSRFDRDKPAAEFYDPATGAFSPAPAPQHPRGFRPVGVILLDGTAVLAGGPPGSRENGVLEGLRPGAKAWQDLYRLPGDMRLSDAVALRDGRVLLVTEEGEAQSLLLWEPSKARLQEVGHASMVVNGCPLGTLLKDGRVLITHLQYGEPKQACPNAYLFDPKTNMATPAARMAGDRGSHQATLLKDGRVLVTGGCDEGPSAEIYDPALNKFLTTTPMVAPRSLHLSLLLPDGRVLVLGGVSDSVGGRHLPFTPEEMAKLPSDELVRKMKEHYEKHPPKPTPLAAEVEIFDPATNHFSAVPDPPVSLLNGEGNRGGLHALLPSGEVLFMSYRGPLLFRPLDLTWYFPELPQPITH